jgi:putative hydrolase of the HAD superfamily
MIRAVLFDFGGVIAEEGFYDGLLAIAKERGLPAEAFFRDVERIIFESGYLTGKADEKTFWNAVRKETGVTGTDEELRHEILRRFVLRPEMLAVADWVRAGGRTVAMLSDQTDWLEEINEKTGLFGHFDRVFNSFRIGKSKRDPSVFTDICRELGTAPAETLFVDDNSGHISRAASLGLATIHFTSIVLFPGQLDAAMGGARV